jgi:hypothetical protein
MPEKTLSESLVPGTIETPESANAVEAIKHEVIDVSADIANRMREIWAKIRHGSKPTVGRMVHYVSPYNGFHQSAIIADDQIDGNIVNLVVHDIQQNPPIKSERGVPRDDNGYARGTWHWPEFNPESADGE